MSPSISQDDGLDRSSNDRSTLNRFPSFGVRRVQAALISDPMLADAEVMHLDRDTTAEEMLAFVDETRPDVLGLAAYVWSSPTLIEVAREVKRRRPECTVVFGGPSAHPRVFDLEPFADREQFADALVVGEGEETFCAVVAAGDRSPDALATIPGLALPRGAAWMRTPPRVANPDMDSIASPYQLGLMPHGHNAYLETFRGCPLSCTFCQWGVMEANRFLSTEYLVRELTALKEARPPMTFLVDAALNLHPRAFRNLVAAEKEVGFFRDTLLLCEVYPNQLRDEHLEFMAGAGGVHIGLGVQSMDTEVLRTSSRPFKPERLRGVIEQLSEYALVDIELILGLPGDTPDTFKRSLELCLELPCSTRVYRCLVLPDALMTRSPESHDIRFDPYSLRLLSCHTWSERDLRRTHDYLDELTAADATATSGDYWWLFVNHDAQYASVYERRHTA
jgi:radical SAM superfamily enzyme YgiQ (UPF0313 family)